jgi:hypothetical protein
MKTDELGGMLWVKMLGGAGNDYADDIAVDPSGSVFIAVRNSQGDGSDGSDKSGAQALSAC